MLTWHLYLQTGTPPTATKPAKVESEQKTNRMKVVALETISVKTTRLVINYFLFSHWLKIEIDGVGDAFQS